jgi:molybdopterin-guanine dinucleotide biosynthesis protein A
MSLSRGAIILCGGASSRMGRDKASLPLESETLLGRAVRLVSDAVGDGPIVCVAAAGQVLPPLPESMQVLRDEQPNCGPLAALAVGMTALGKRADAAFVCGCDAPRLTKAFILRMFDLLADHPIAVPFDGEHVHPLAAVYRTDTGSIAESLLSSGERSLVSLVNRCDSLRVPVDDLRAVDPQLASLENCNTPDDYLRELVAALPKRIES